MIYTIPHGKYKDQDIVTLSYLHICKILEVDKTIPLDIRNYLIGRMENAWLVINAKKERDIIKQELESKAIEDISTVDIAYMLEKEILSSVMRINLLKEIQKRLFVPYDTTEINDEGEVITVHHTVFNPALDYYIEEYC